MLDSKAGQKNSWMVSLQQQLRTFKYIQYISHLYHHSREKVLSGELSYAVQLREVITMVHHPEILK